MQKVAERGNKDKCSLQVLSEQKTISVNKVRLSRKQILQEGEEMASKFT